MATKPGIGRAVEQLRASGCFNQHLEDSGALRLLIDDWHAAFSDLSDGDLKQACAMWLETEEGRRWPTKYDIRSMLEQLAASRPLREIKGCEACTFTGWREIVRIDPRNDKRTRWVAPCDCPKGYRLSHPPPPKPTEKNPALPPEPYDVVAEVWRALGFEVHVATEGESTFPLILLDTSEATAERIAKGHEHYAGKAEALVKKLADSMRMFPDDPPRSHDAPNE